MVYCKTVNIERIVVHPANTHRSSHVIEMIKYGDEPVFSIGLDDGDDEWYWEFDMTCPSNYERVKLTLFDMVYECDNMFELAELLDEVFWENFEDILIDTYEPEYDNYDDWNE